MTLNSIINLEALLNSIGLPCNSSWNLREINYFFIVVLICGIIPLLILSALSRLIVGSVNDTDRNRHLGERIDDIISRNDRSIRQELKRLNVELSKVGIKAINTFVDQDDTVQKKDVENF